jgi:Tfp pilus assembly protein PilF
MTEALIAALSQIRALRVVSRTSVMQYKQARKPLKGIARELNVDLVVEGSVIRAGDRVQVTAQLIDAASDRHLWAKSYDRELSDDIARAITQEIRANVTPQEQARLAAVHPVNPEAHEAYLMGRYLWNKRNEASFKQALEYFHRSLEKDPTYAPAYAGIAATYNLMQFYAGFSPHAVFPKARAAARKALELDEALPEAHAALAYVSAYYDWDWVTADREFQRALELNPNGAEVYHSYSRFLAARGHVEDALVKMKQAQERNPVPLILKVNEAVILYFARRNDQAIEQLHKTLELDPNFWVAHWGLGMAHEQRGAYSDAVAEFQKAIALSRGGGGPNMDASLGHTYAVMGDRANAQRVLDELSQKAKLSYVPAYFAATIHAGLGDKDRAFEWLEKAYEEHSTLMSYLKMDPRLDSLRSDRRFNDLLGRVGLASP